MNNPSADDKRYSVLRILSRDETSHLQANQNAVLVKHGEEYLDLENLHEGVHRAFGTSNSAPGRLLPRRFVEDSTWNAILLALAPRQLPETD